MWKSCLSLSLFLLIHELTAHRSSCSPLGVIFCSAHLHWVVQTVFLTRLYMVEKFTLFLWKGSPWKWSQRWQVAPAAAAFLCRSLAWIRVLLRWSLQALWFSRPDCPADGSVFTTFLQQMFTCALASQMLADLGRVSESLADGLQHSCESWLLCYHN